MNQSKAVAIDPGTITVGEMVAQNYHTAGIFRQFGLDFCCGGSLSITDACEKQQLDLNEVVSKLQEIPWNQPSAAENFQAWEPAYLIDHIVHQHHQFVRTKSREIAEYAAKVARVHGERHPENIDIYHRFVKLANEMFEHMDDEEQRVFPLIREVSEARQSGGEVSADQVQQIKAELDHMIEDHEQAGALMDEIRQLSNDFTPPADACATYRILYQNLKGYEEDLHKHVHLENNILFRKAEKLV